MIRMESKVMILLLIIMMLITSVSAINLNDLDTSHTTNIYTSEYNLSNINISLENNSILENNITNYKSKIKDKQNVNPILEEMNKSNNTTDDEKLWDKSRPIYFAMDHADSNDEQIRDTVVNKLKENGFNVVRAEIGPSQMHSTLLYLYENDIHDAVVFHLLNGVDPSNIRELARNGDDNRGRVVRSNGNDVVLAWFYDSSDPVHEDGSSYKVVPGSETGSSLENPKEYMDENDVYYICTSSDMGKHKEDADYTGEKTAEEFMKLFK